MNGKLPVISGKEGEKVADISNEEAGELLKPFRNIFRSFKLPDVTSSPH